MANLEDRLAGIVGAGNVLVGEPMSAHTTFRVGGPADFLAVPQDASALRELVGFCRDEGIEWRILGHGSNVLVSDAGLRGVTVKVSGNLGEVELRDGSSLVAGAGASNAKVAAAAQRAGLAGFEFAAGIPGTIGGAAIMNAGAYGGEFAQVARSVSCIGADGALVEMPAAQAQWGYRSSAMMREGLVVVSAILDLQPDDPEAIRAHMAELARRRQEKQPIELPSAGSAFKRPPGHFAGKLVQEAGMQGYRVGGAEVSCKHAGFVVNGGGATAADVLAVMRDVRARVLDLFGVGLEPEVRLWGFEEGDPLTS